MDIVARHKDEGTIMASNPDMLATFFGVSREVIEETASLGLSVFGWSLSWDDHLPEEFPDDDDTMDMDDEPSWNRKR